MRFFKRLVLVVPASPLLALLVANVHINPKAKAEVVDAGIMLVPSSPRGGRDGVYNGGIIHEDTSTTAAASTSPFYGRVVEEGSNRIMLTTRIRASRRGGGGSSSSSRS